MYSALIKIEVPGKCYFCLRSFLGMNTFAIVEKHIFCTNCGYEVMESNLEVVKETVTAEERDYGYNGRIGEITGS